jgi:predicted nuclease of predicted toxin-antitoxin system
LKLLFDENLAAELVDLLADIYPESTHVSAIGLNGAPDRVIWDHARTGGFVLVTKDGDFHRLSVFLGPPPNVVWVRLGNSPTSDVGQLLREQLAAIHAFVGDTDIGFFAIG